MALKENLELGNRQRPVLKAKFRGVLLKGCDNRFEWDFQSH